MSRFRASRDAGHRWRLVDPTGRPVVDNRGAGYRSGQAAHRAADAVVHAKRRAAERAQLRAVLDAWADGPAFCTTMDQRALELGLNAGRVTADDVRRVLVDLGTELPPGASAAAVAALWRRVPTGRRRR